MKKLEEIKTYYENTDYISQSFLKKFYFHPKKAISEVEPKLYFEEKDHFETGSAVDTIITLGENVFKLVYHFGTLEKKPTKTVRSILHQIHDEGKGVLDDELILKACTNHNYQPRWLDSTKIENIRKEEYYFNEITKAKQGKGKTLLTVEQVDFYHYLANNILSSEITGPFFNPKHKELDAEGQLALYFEDRKGLLDWIIFNNSDKDLILDNGYRIGARSIVFIDIKTMEEPVSEFGMAMRRHHYYIQDAWYYDLLKSIYGDSYTIQMPVFVVESTGYPGNPVYYTITEDQLEIGRNGAEIVEDPFYINLSDGKQRIMNRDRRILGYNDLLSRYQFYLENGDEYDKDYEEKDRKVKIW